MQNLIRDIRFAFRSLVRKPGLAITAVTALGLGIGLATAMFSIVNGVGGVALFLATIGLYGVLPFQVNQRTREVGLRVGMRLRFWASHESQDCSKGAGASG